MRSSALARSRCQRRTIFRKKGSSSSTRRAKSAPFALPSRATASAWGDTLANAEFSSTRPVRALFGGRAVSDSAVLNRFAGASAIAAKLLQQSSKVTPVPYAHERAFPRMSWRFVEIDLTRHLRGAEVWGANPSAHFPD